MISLHTSPLLQPGAGDSGGMNVYVREVASALAQAGVECTTYTRADRPGLPAEVTVEPGHTVVHVPAGPYDLPKEALADELDAFTAGVLGHIRSGPGIDVVHGNYWLSGVVGHRLKHVLEVPLVATFHTLARVKAEGGDLEPAWRDRAEAEVIGCSDAICVSCPEEERQFRRLYGDPSGRIEIVPPAVEHAFFAPGDRDGARRAVGLPIDRPVILFVGRIQPLKAPDLAIRALAALPQRHAMLVIVGGPAAATATVRSRSPTRWPPSSVWPIGCASSRHSRTTSCPATTGPPTWWSCRVAARASAWSPWKQRRAGCPSWPARSAACSTSSTTESPATSWTDATLPATPGRSARSSTTRSGRRRWGRRRRAGPPVHVGVHRGPVAAGLQRPVVAGGARARRLRMSRWRVRCTA